MGISSPGVGSGLDVKYIVDKLVSADILPSQNRLARQAKSVQTSLSSIGLMKNSLSKLQTNIKVLADTKSFFTMKNTLSDNDHFSVTNTGQTDPGIYQIEIAKLAQRQSLASTPVTSDFNVGHGTMTIQLGTYNADNTVFTNNASKPPIEIIIPNGVHTIKDVKDIINAKNAGIEANLIQDSLGSRLTITSKDTGQNYSMKIAITNDGGSGLSAFAYDPTMGINNMTETVRAQDSEVKINGITLVNSSNTLKDTIAGLTIDLKKQDPGKTTTLTLEKDKAAVTQLIKNLVAQYNETLSSLNMLTNYDPKTEVAGPMQGDAGTRMLKFNLQSWASDPINEDLNSINTLNSIGIKITNKGTLEIDDKKLASALDANFDEVAALFTTKNESTKKQGLAVKLDGFLNSYLNSTTGELSMREKQMDKRMKKLNVENDALIEKAKNLEQRYLKQFNSLDALLSKMQNISNSLGVQLNNLPTNNSR